MYLICLHYDSFVSVGLSQDEWGRFMKRVPTHLKEKFEDIKNDFTTFDENKDNVIDSDEFGKMLDEVMKETETNKSPSSGDEQR